MTSCFVYRWWWWWWWFFHLHVDGNNNPNEFLVIQQVCGEAERGDEISVDELKTYSVFPGQIVGVEGKNPSGRKMVASKICEGVSKVRGCP